MCVFLRCDSFSARYVHQHGLAHSILTMGMMGVESTGVSDSDRRGREQDKRVQVVFADVVKSRLNVGDQLAP